MRNFIFYLTLMLCCLTGCEEKIAQVSISNELEKTFDSVLKVDFKELQTKVSSQTLANEKSIQNVQVFVFRASEGQDKALLDVSASDGFTTALNESSGSYNGITLKCSSGLKEIYAIVNDSKDRSSIVGEINCKEDLLSQYHDLNNSTATKLLMIGKTDLTVNPGEQNISISVKRQCASVILESVKNDYASLGNGNEANFKLEDVYLLNVPGRIDFGKTGLASDLDTQYWYNKRAKDTDESKLLLTYDAQSEGVAVNYGSTYSTKHSFYTYPNDCSASTDEDWSPRATVLVVEASIYHSDTWNKYYYPVTIAPEGGIQSNKQYKVNLTIHRPGSTDPNIPVELYEVTPLITVEDWETGETIAHEI